MAIDFKENWAVHPISAVQPWVSVYASFYNYEEHNEVSNFYTSTLLDTVSIDHK